jgi:hypothetical protein
MLKFRIRRGIGIYSGWEEIVEDSLVDVVDDRHANVVGLEISFFRSQDPVASTSSSNN